MAKFYQVQEESSTQPNTNLNGDVVSPISSEKKIVYFSTVILRRPNS